MFGPIVTRIITLLLFTAVTLSGQQVREITREFTVSSAPTLDVDLTFGELEFVPGPAGAVKIEVVQSISLKDEDRARDVLKDWEFTFSQDGATVVFKGSSRQNVIWDWDPVRQVHCSVRITAPVASNVRIKGVQIRTVIEQIDGDLSLRADGGSIHARRVGGKVDARLLGGQLLLSSVQGAIDVNIGNGVVLIGSASGPVHVASQGGSVEIQQAAGSVDIRGDALDVLLGLANPRSGDASVKTTAGSIVLKIEQTANVCIDAAAPWLGEVNARGLELDVLSGSSGSSRLKARLNEGDSRVKLRASGGKVSIVGVEPLGPTIAADLR